MVSLVPGDAFVWVRIYVKHVCVFRTQVLLK